MANRPVFVIDSKPPYYQVVNVEFKWSGGFAKSQSQKNITAIHSSFSAMCPDHKVLEISSKSLQEEGVYLSAFSLDKYVPYLNKKIPVECIYQGSKVFENGGLYTDLYLSTPKQAKTDSRLKNSGKLIGFEFNGEKYPLTEIFTFYDYIYISALNDNRDLAEKLLKYSAFTDIIFVPSKGINC